MTGKSPRIKALTFRSYISILTKELRYDAVVAAVPAETARLMAAPPLAASWMDFRHLVYIGSAVEVIGGTTAVRDLARKATDDARKPYMGVVESVLKLFGTSPATLFKRMSSLVNSFIQGVDFEYTPLSERSGTMEVQYHADYEIPNSVFVGVAPTFQTLLDACGATGVVGPAQRISATAARFSIRW